MKKNILYSLLLIISIVYGYNVYALDKDIYNADGFRIDQNISNTVSATDENSPSLADSSDAITDDTGAVATTKAGVKQGEIDDCFMYYNFGGVNLALQTDSTTYNPGDAVIIRGGAFNQNSYPLTGLTIKARVFKNAPNPNMERAEIITLDEFDIVKNINIAGQKSYAINTSYILPTTAAKGDYQVVFFVYNHERYNQSGLTFTNDITALKLSFAVGGSNTDQFYIDQTRITVNDKTHNVMAFMTNHSTSSVLIKAPIVNADNQESKVKVTYKTYIWDALQSKNLIQEKTEDITIPANGEFVLEYLVENTNKPAYLVHIEAINNKNIKTQTQIRFSVNGYDYVRVNSAGINTYPIYKNQEATVFTCFHNGSNQNATSTHTIKTIVYDEKDNILGMTEYSGTVDSDIYAIANKFTTKKDVFNYKVVTTLADSKGVIIDEIQQIYSCKDIDSTLCPEEGLGINPFIFAWIILALITLFIIYKIIKHMRTKTLMTLLIIISTLSMTSTHKVEAVSVTAPFESKIVCVKECKAGGAIEVVSVKGTFGGSFQKVFNFNKSGYGNIPQSGYNLNVGESINAVPEATKGDWFFAGGYNDSPPMNGVFYVLDDKQDIGADSTNVFNSDVSSESISVSVPIDKNQVKIQSANSKIIECSNNICNAKSPGTTTITVSFANSTLTSNYNIYKYDYDANGIKTDNKIKTQREGFGMVNIAYRRYRTLVDFRKFQKSATEPADDFAYGSATYSFPSITYTINVPATNNTPHVVTYEKADGIQADKATIHWTYTDADNDAQTNYQVQISDKADFSNIITSYAYTTGDVATMRSISATGLTPSTIYYVRVKAYNNTNAWSNWSNGTFTTTSLSGGTCSCNNRDLICSNGGVNETTKNAAQCNLIATCSATANDTEKNTISYTVIPQNKVGNILYMYNGQETTSMNPQTYIVSADLDQISVTLKDVFDNQSYTAICKKPDIDKKVAAVACTPPQVSDGKGSCVDVIACPKGQFFYPGNGSCTKPSINITKKPELFVKKGGSCIIDWKIIVPENANCRIKGTDGYDQSIDVGNRATGNYEKSNFIENIKYTVSCDSGDLEKALSKSLTCRLDPNVIEN